jgi:protein KRI1
MPTRFKYASVPAQDFQLTPAEILMADDTDLNQYMSIKKYAPYRKNTMWDRNRGERLKEFKQKVKSCTLGDAGQINSEPKKRKGKKERMRLKQIEEEKEKETEKMGSLFGKGSTQDNQESGGEDMEDKKKRKRNNDVDDHNQNGQETKKKRKRRKKNAEHATSHT